MANLFLEKSGNFWNLIAENPADPARPLLILPAIRNEKIHELRKLIDNYSEYCEVMRELRNITEKTFNNQLSRSTYFKNQKAQIAERKWLDELEF